MRLSFLFDTLQKKITWNPNNENMSRKMWCQPTRDLRIIMSRETMANTPYLWRFSTKKTSHHRSRHFRYFHSSKTRTPGHYSVMRFFVVFSAHTHAHRHTDKHQCLFYSLFTQYFSPFVCFVNNGISRTQGTVAPITNFNTEMVLWSSKKAPYYTCPPVCPLTDQHPPIGKVTRHLNTSLELVFIPGAHKSFGWSFQFWVICEICDNNNSRETIIDSFNVILGCLANIGENSSPHINIKYLEHRTKYNQVP